MQENLAQLLEVSLSLSRKAVGVKFFLSKEAYDLFDAPEGKKRMPYCTSVRMATEGALQKVRGVHQGCPGGAVALGFELPTMASLSGARRLSQETCVDLCTARKISRNMVYCEHETYGLAVQPLEAFKEAPDIVIIVCDPYNAMRVVQGYAYHHGHVSDVKLSGMQALCQECTSLPFERDQLNLSMLCAGTRKVCGWRCDEMAIGIPYHSFASVVDGILKTINPLERNPSKTRILERIKKSELNPDIQIVFNKNYDDKAYKGGHIITD